MDIQEAAEVGVDSPWRPGGNISRMALRAPLNPKP